MAPKVALQNFAGISALIERAAAWRSYVKQVPCSEHSELEGWAPAASVVLSEAGSALRLLAKGIKPLACRFAWRAFPCERMGCGLYAAAADGLEVPPPPFYVAL